MNWFTRRKSQPSACRSYIELFGHVVKCDDVEGHLKSHSAEVSAVLDGDGTITLGLSWWKWEQ